MMPATISVRLNASDEMSSVMPSALRLFFHHSGSLAVSMLAMTPSARKTASRMPSSCRSMCVAEKNVAYAVSAAAAPEMMSSGSAKTSAPRNDCSEDDGEQGPAQQGDDRVGERERGDVDDVEHAEATARRAVRMR